MEEELGVYHVASPMSCLRPCPRAISRHAPQSPVLYINWQLVQKSGQMRAQCSVGETTSGVVCTRENSHPWIPAGVLQNGAARILPAFPRLLAGVLCKEPLALVNHSSWVHGRGHG